MYITKKKSGIGSLNKPCKICGEGLGDEVVPDTKANQKEYGGMSKEAPMVGMGIKLAATVALMFIPVVGWAAAIAINLPVIGDAVMGPIMGPIMGMMKKATHMESCMNWWTDSNIRGMVTGIVPYPINAEVRHEYRLQHAQEMTVNESGRQYDIVNRFIRLVRANPDIMTFQCATMPQGRAETGMTEADAAKAQEYWAQLKEQARQEEYYSIVGSIGVTVAQKATAVQETRQAASIFQLPTGVVSIDKGALVLKPGVSSNKVIEVFTTGQAVQRNK